MWKIIAGVRVKQLTQPDYYPCLVRLHDEGHADLENIISLDVKRTPEAVRDSEFSATLSRVLNAYAKFI
jgi:hypothetical protein